MGLLAREKVELDSVEQSEENPIVNTVNQHSLKRHRLATEDMNIGSFILSLKIVQNSHNQSYSLDGSI
jgi:hypothetical protein